MITTQKNTISLLFLFVLISGCTYKSSAPDSDYSDSSEFDLPDIFLGAHKVDVSVVSCDDYNGSPTPSMSLTNSGRTLYVHYNDVVYRSGQKLCAYEKEITNMKNVIIQPCEMNPTSIVLSSCLTDSIVTFEGDVGINSVEAFYRWDNLNEPNDAISIGAAEIAIDG